MIFCGNRAIVSPCFFHLKLSPRSGGSRVAGLADPRSRRATPERTCLACGRKRAKTELLRISHQSGTFVIDARQNLPGRGAYLCPTDACAELLLRRKGLHHGFRREVPAAVYLQIIDFVRQAATAAD